MTPDNVFRYLKNKLEKAGVPVVVTGSCLSTRTGLPVLSIGNGLVTVWKPDLKDKVLSFEPIQLLDNNNSYACHAAVSNHLVVDTHRDYDWSRLNVAQAVARYIRDLFAAHNIYLELRGDGRYVNDDGMVVITICEDQQTVVLWCRPEFSMGGWTCTAKDASSFKYIDAQHIVSGELREIVRHMASHIHMFVAFREARTQMRDTLGSCVITEYSPAGGGYVSVSGFGSVMEADASSVRIFDGAEWHDLPADMFNASKDIWHSLVNRLISHLDKKQPSAFHVFTTTLQGLGIPVMPCGAGLLTINGTTLAEVEGSALCMYVDILFNPAKRTLSAGPSCKLKISNTAHANAAKGAAELFAASWKRWTGLQDLKIGTRAFMVKFADCIKELVGPSIDLNHREYEHGHHLVNRYGDTILFMDHTRTAVYTQFKRANKHVWYALSDHDLTPVDGDWHLTVLEHHVKQLAKDCISHSKPEQ